LENSVICFSIVVPTFNRGQLIKQTIGSFLKQDNISLELIIVDDGGQDNTEVLVNEINDQRIRYVKTENRERGAARNFGAKIARGNYINYFDSDDIASPCLSDLHLFILENNSPDVVYGLIENVTEEGTPIEVVTQAYPDFKKSLLHNNFLACGAVFIKREVALRFPFSEDRRLSATEDWEAWLRLFSNHDFVKFPAIVFKQRLHSSRSLANVRSSRVTEREIVFVDHIRRHQDVLAKRFSSSELNLLIADRYTLIALTQTESGSRKVAVNYLFNSFFISPFVVQRRRFWAVLKKLILG
jgi:glycosyltransferase involved in cell wall biosynthesis